MKRDLPSYLSVMPEVQGVRRRRRWARRAAAVALFPVHLVIALWRWVTAPCCEL